MSRMAEVWQERDEQRQQEEMEECLAWHEEQRNLNERTNYEEFERNKPCQPLVSSSAKVEAEKLQACATSTQPMPF